MYIYDFLKRVGNNIRASFPLNAVVTACFFLFFDNNIFSVNILLAFDNDNVTLIQTFKLHTLVLFPIFFSASKSKVNLYIKNFIENQLSVEDNQVHGSVTVRSMKCLPPKLGGYVFLPSYVILDFSNLTILRSTSLE